MSCEKLSNKTVLQCTQFFRRAHFCKKTGVFWTKIRPLDGCKDGRNEVFVILSSFCDLVHIQSVVDLFAKQLYNGVERSEHAQNHK